ncbi:MAG: [FeFe] hydrogenase H-cluster maturation GTPase HydF [Acidobacteriota bacterium]|jgi:[FeFe] hydrogenase H-cluster maturation GTPase HydF|nr:[FeFe] hydrogenase H-cluster maturation GTPase HydF [Acidobacteriota bacterium]NLT31853.1 [FeFe] hydrogenase H-cluster maturation GTPase HydF [Acidobacteriota bacterium]
MKATPKGMRVHIGLFGRRNVGKSSLLNALTRQEVSIVSDVPGTTTDPVEKPMELPPLGPVLFIDTAGIDDEGALGEVRAGRTRQVFERTDLGILVAAGADWGSFEEGVLGELERRKIPVIVVFNKSDLGAPAPATLRDLEKRKIPVVVTAAGLGRGIGGLREALVRSAPEEFLEAPPILGDLIAPGSMVVLVVPIDLEAPRGRLILPQVQSIRDVLDHDSCCLVVKERELRTALGRLRESPALVVTDSQVFLRVAGDVPDGVPLTSFSILFARLKGDLAEFVRGVKAVDRLRAGDRVLVLESCAHHPIGEDIGRVKIPRWIRQYTGADLEFVHLQGHDFPEEIGAYQLVIHCGSCMLNRREVLSRILRCREAGVPITNYGVAITYSLGVLDRALSPFPGFRGGR